jgi:phosphatidylglycerophosphate synthase
VFLAGFIGFFTVPFLTYLLLLWFGRLHLPAAKPKGSGHRLFGPVFIGYYYWLLGPLFQFLARTRLTPNHVTCGSLVIAAATGTAIATGHFAVASVLLIGSGTLDIVDGELARAKRMTTARGAFLDSTVDRICDGLYFGGCVVYYAGSWMMLVCLLVLVMSFTVSYTRARGEALGIVGAEGLAQRADRIAFLSIALAFSPFFGHRMEGYVAHPFYAITAVALCILALLNTVTAISRIAWTMERLKDDASVSMLRMRNDASPHDVREAANDATPLLNQRAR